MRRDLLSSVIAVVLFTVLFGLAYPLITTGIAQLVFPHQSDGSRIERNGETVGSDVIGQDFTKRVPRKSGSDSKHRFRSVADPRYFQSRPSATKYSADVTFFNNLGPNDRDLANEIKKRISAYLDLERRYMPGLGRQDVPVDAVTTSASGVDPHISKANARIQANRIAKVRGIPRSQVLDLVNEKTDGRALGFLGEPGVNVLKLNLALDEETGQ